jgi:hypothetical protein
VEEWRFWKKAPGDYKYSGWIMNNKIGLIFAFLLLSYSLSKAGEYHNQGDVICSDCHTTHYSERGTLPEGAEAGGPFPDMLLVSSIDHLCMSCHDGTDPAAPDVLAPVVMYNGSGSEFSGAGYFSEADGVMSPLGHDLGVTSLAPYSIPAKTMVLSCVSCHDPHGTSNYRNLLLNPDSSGGDINLTLNSDIFEENNPANPPSRGTSIMAYRSNNTGYRDKMTNWCTDCHNALSPDNPGSSPAHFMRHPSAASFDISSYHISSSHWITGSGEGFGLAAGDGIEGIPRLRFQAPGATDYISSKVPARTNELFCGTCHLAHGGPFQSSLLWPYKTSGQADLYSGCQQCHIK